MDDKYSIRAYKWTCGESISFVDLLVSQERHYYKIRIDKGKDYFNSDEFISEFIKEVISPTIYKMRGGDNNPSIWQYHDDDFTDINGSQIRIEFVAGTILDTVDYVDNKTSIPFKNILNNIKIGYIKFPNVNDPVDISPILYNELQFQLSVKFFKENFETILSQYSTCMFNLDVKDPDLSSRVLNAKVGVESSICDTDGNFNFVYLLTDSNGCRRTLSLCNDNGTIRRNLIDLEDLTNYAKQILLEQSTDALGSTIIYKCGIQYLIEMDNVSFYELNGRNTEVIGHLETGKLLDSM